jgi:hypothetical protein
MRTRDRFRYIFHPRPPTWRERFERGEGPLFWALTLLFSAATACGLLLLMTLEP